MSYYKNEKVFSQDTELLQQVIKTDYKIIQSSNEEYGNKKMKRTHAKLLI